jgi:hypothetical protein
LLKFLELRGQPFPLPPGPRCANAPERLRPLLRRNARGLRGTEGEEGAGVAYR